jgi:hypothetical protein
MEVKTTDINTIREYQIRYVYWFLMMVSYNKCDYYFECCPSSCIFFKHSVHEPMHARTCTHTHRGMWNSHGWNRETNFNTFIIILKASLKWNLANYICGREKQHSITYKDEVYLMVSEYEKVFTLPAILCPLVYSFSHYVFLNIISSVRGL